MAGTAPRTVLVGLVKRRGHHVVLSLPHAGTKKDGTWCRPFRETRNRLLDRGVVGRDEEFGLHAVRLGDRQRAAGLLLGSFLGGNPSRISAEGVEAGLGGIFALVVEEVDEGVAGDVGALGTLLVSGQVPVADVGHAVLFEEL